MVIGIFGAVGHETNNPSGTKSNDYISGELLVGFTKNINVKELNIGDYDPILNKEIIKKFDSINCVLVKIDKGTENKYINLYESNSDVSYAEKNGIVRMLDYPYEPNDPQWVNQYGPKSINCPQAWSYSYTHSATIAIVDTGIHLTHEDLTGRLVNGYNAINNAEQPQDDNGHGTHCAGIAAAVTDNGKGIAGVCGKVNDINLMPVKVLDADGSGSFATVADGITWATDNGANVISMSLGSTVGSDAIKDACDNAYKAGITVVAAAGNEGNAAPHYPAAYDSVISVAAIDSSNEKASFSTYGDWVDLAAPGVHILSSFWKSSGETNIYEYLSGTSMACPHVSGVAALGIAKGLSDVRQKLFDTAIDIGHTGTYWKYGKVDATFAGGSQDVGVNIKIDKITLKDDIEAPGAGSPEWFYEVDASHSDRRIVQQNLYIPSNAPYEEDDELNGDWIKVFKLPEDYSNQNDWMPTYVHTLWLADNDIHVAANKALVNVKITLMEKDLFLDDIADISYEKNADGDWSWLPVQQLAGRQFNCVYDLVTNKLTDFGGSKKKGGSDDGGFPRETAGWWDGSQADGEGALTWKEDDELIEFTITDTYEAVKADAGGPYTGVVNVGLELSGSAGDGVSPYTYSWDFGDGDTGSGETTTHTYTETGTYTVTLTVTDGVGVKSTDTATVNIVSNTEPDEPSIDGPSSGSPGTTYSFTFSATDPDGSYGDKVSYGIDWGDGSGVHWTDYVSSGTEVTKTHSWGSRGSYTIKAKAKDLSGAESDWATLRISMPKNKACINKPFLNFLTNHPNLFIILQKILQRLGP